MSESKDFRCGLVAVVGRPNVGKSTLVNALVGRKISIVTDKPQTTRHRILALLHGDDHQAVFIDTPGLHRKAGKAMNRLMNKAAINALADADVVLFVTEAGRYRDEDDDVLQRLGGVEVPVVAVLNKIDRVEPKSRLLEAIAALDSRREFAAIVPTSATAGDNLDELKAVLLPFLPISPALFPADMASDRSEAFHVAEVVREKLMQHLHQELPYGLTVQTERIGRDAGGVSVDAVVWVERDSQKGIVVGKNGAVLKRVGRAARLELKDWFGVPVHLNLWVKLKSNWADNEQDLLSLGYETP